MTHVRLPSQAARCTLSREIVGSALFAGHVETRVATGMRFRRTYLTWFDGDVVEACMDIQCHYGRSNARIDGDGVGSLRVHGSTSRLERRLSAVQVDVKTYHVTGFPRSPATFRGVGLFQYRNILQYRNQYDDRTEEFAFFVCNIRSL